MELQNRFGIRAEIVDATEALDRLRSSNTGAGQEGFALIGSMQGMRPAREWRFATSPPKSREKLAEFLDQRAQDSPLIDLLVIDEAHHMRNSGTSTNELGHLLRAVSSQVVLLSATPVNLHSEDLFTLMQMIDPDTFANAWEFADVLRANGPLVAARDRVLRGQLSSSEFVEALQNAKAHPILQASQTLSWIIEHPPTDDDLQRPHVRADLAHQLDQANLLGQVINRTRKRDVQEHRIVRNAVAEAVRLSALEAEFYRKVTASVREFCKKNNAAIGFILTMPQRLMASSIPAAFRYWQEGLGATYFKTEGETEDEDDLDLFAGDARSSETEMGVLVRELVGQVKGLGSFQALKAADSKYQRLHDALGDYFQEYPDGKVVLFTSFRATLRYLSERLRDDGFVTALMHGDTEDKDVVIDAFREHQGGMVLLSSEVGSEGVDLQFARLIVNYDLPWNPMRVEQRIGRLDRLGQTAESISIWNLYCADTIDERIYERLYERIGIFKQALGELEPILGEPIQRLTRDLLMDELTPEQELERIEATAVAIENNRKSIEVLEANAAQFFALGDYLIDRVKDAQRLGRHIMAEDLRNYVVSFLRAHHPNTELLADHTDPLALQIRLKPEAKVALEEFTRRHRLGRSTRLTMATGGPLRCRFENSVIESDSRGEEVISQFHPLVRYARERLTESESDLRLAISARIAAAEAGRYASGGRYAFVVERWAITGIQQIEKLAYEAIDLASLKVLDEDMAEGLVNRTASVGGDWLSAATDVSMAAANVAAEKCYLRLNERYETFERTVRLQNEDRANSMLVTLERQVAGQVDRIEGVNARFRISGQLRLIPANEGRIKKLHERADMRRAEIEGRTKVQVSRMMFLTGVIDVVQ